MKSISFFPKFHYSFKPLFVRKAFCIVVIFILTQNVLNAQTPTTVTADIISAPNGVVIGDGNNPSSYSTGQSTILGYNNINISGTQINNSIFGIGNTVSGQSTFVFGKNNISSGNYSSILGRSNTSSGMSSYLFGSLNQDFGDRHAIILGIENIVEANAAWGHAIGHRNIIRTNTMEAYAFGQDNKNGGSSSYTIGYLNETHGHASYAIGKQNYIAAAAEYADAFGRSNYVYSLNGLCFGFSNNVAANSEGGMCFGNKNVVSGYVAAAFGYKNIASGGSSLAFGNKNTASGSDGSAVGYNNTASGGGSVALGKENLATAYAAVSVGYKNQVSGIYSSAFGYTNTASGERSIVFGYKSVATGKKSGAIGFMVTNTTENSLKVGASESAYLMMIANSNPANQGYVGLGTMTPTANFHTVGSVRLQGYPNTTITTVNKVLSTDANGYLTLVNSYWQPHTNTSTITYDGVVGIGMNNTATISASAVSSYNYKLLVAGSLGARKVRVTQVANWADYVFADDYKLQPLAEVEKFVKTNKHLEGVPTEKEVKENGVDLGDTQVILLKKIEELTLHLIEQNKKIEKLEKEVSKLKKS